MNKGRCFGARIPLSGSVLLSALQSRPPLWFSNAISDLHYNESRRETFVRARLFFQPEWKECGRNWFPFLCAAVRLEAGRKRGMCMKPTPFLRSFTHTKQRVRFVLSRCWDASRKDTRTPRAPTLAPNQPFDLFQPCNSPQWALSCSSSRHSTHHGKAWRRNFVFLCTFHAYLQRKNNQKSNPNNAQYYEVNKSSSKP